MMKLYENLIRVNGHDMNVFGAGEGKQTIVFLAGAMVTSPVLEYKPLWERLTDTFRIAVVEKAGYGFSQGCTDAPRDAKTMVDESREALAKAGIAPPYCLAAHSYSGLEAIFWASYYPSEVNCILGLDMVTPPFALAQDKELPAEKKTAMVDKQNRFFRMTQKSKLLQNFCVKAFFGKAAVWKNDFLNEEERAAYRELYFRNLCNAEFREEQGMAAKNAQLVKDADLQGIPALLFISDMDAMLKHTTWKAENTAYAKAQGWQIRDAKSHQLYAEQTEEIVRAWKEFTQTIPSKGQKPMRQIESLFQTADTLVPPRPMTELVPELCEDTDVFASKMGGMPYLPKAMPWPMGEGEYDGKPLRLLAQLNFAQLPPLPDFPTKGILQFYIADADDFLYGMKYGENTCQDGFRVLYHADVSDDSAQLWQKADAPTVTSDADCFPFKGTFRLRAKSQMNCLATPQDHRYLRELLKLFNAAVGTTVTQLYELYNLPQDCTLADDFFEKIDELYTTRSNERTCIGGYPSFTQDDPRDDDADVLLFQSASFYDRETKAEILWGDMGIANFFISREDLKQRNFSRVFYTWDCG